jgi:hypothetical protein
MKVRILAVLALFAVAVIATAAVATAAAPPGKTDAQVLGHVRIDPNDPTVAYVTAQYICQGGMTEETHLWVSVKQTASRLPDNRLKEEESSAISAAWSQSHPTSSVVCDGQWHTQTFTVSHAEYGFGELQAGQAYVQFCLFGGDGTFVFSMRFAAIK